MSVICQPFDIGITTLSITNACGFTQEKVTFILVHPLSFYKNLEYEIYPNSVTSKLDKSLKY